jgi:hypothetical protein
VSKKKNEEKVLDALRFYGASSFGELQQRSGVRGGSFGRTLGRLLQSEQIVKTKDGEYRLPDYRIDVVLGNLNNPDSGSDSSDDTPENGSSGSGEEVAVAAETGIEQQKAQEGEAPSLTIPVPKRTEPRASGVRKWHPEFGFISFEEDQRRKMGDPNWRDG